MGAAEPLPCRSCGTPVVFADHERTHKQAPLEPDPQGPWAMADGVYWMAGADYDGPRYTNHFARCPQAGRWRGG